MRTVNDSLSSDAAAVAQLQHSAGPGPGPGKAISASSSSSAMANHTFVIPTTDDFNTRADYSAAVLPSRPGSWVALLLSVGALCLLSQ